MPLNEHGYFEGMILDTAVSLLNLKPSILNYLPSKIYLLGKGTSWSAILRSQMLLTNFLTRRKIILYKGSLDTRQNYTLLKVIKCIPGATSLFVCD